MTILWSVVEVCHPGTNKEILRGSAAKLGAARNEAMAKWVALFNGGLRAANKTGPVENRPLTRRELVR